MTEPGPALDERIATEIMGLVPCDEWRAVEWDGVIGFRCYAEEPRTLVWPEGGVSGHLFYGPQGSGIRRGLCYPTGIRESSEYREKDETWSELPIRHAGDVCDYYQTPEVFGPPPYSTDTAAAISALEHHGQHWEVTRTPDGFVAQTRDAEGFRTGFGVGDTLAHAACLALLEAVGSPQHTETT